MVFEIGSLTGSILETNYQTRNRSLFFLRVSGCGGWVGGARVCVRVVVAKRGGGAKVVAKRKGVRGRGGWGVLWRRRRRRKKSTIKT